MSKEPECHIEWIDDDRFYLVYTRTVNDVSEQLNTPELKEQVKKTNEQLVWTSMPNSYEVPEKQRIKPKTG